MPSIEFPYAVRRDKEGWYYYPVVAADIQTPEGAYPVRLLLDSGADCTMLPRFLGELMGLNFSLLPKLTVTGVESRGVKAYRGKVKMRIADSILPPIPCVFGQSDETPLLLGREGFFDLFNITLDNRRKKVVLTRLFGL